jgi:hypothetical protein
LARKPAKSFGCPFAAPVELMGTEIGGGAANAGAPANKAVATNAVLVQKLA